jgi:hypothetical protein
MAKTIASGVGMTNAWLAEQGVLSLKTLWAELAHLRGTARCGPACRGGVGRVVRNDHPYPIYPEPEVAGVRTFNSILPVLRSMLNTASDRP